jgi:hypothetical protein
VDRRDRRKGSSQGRAEGRVRGRVRERVQGRPQRKRGTLDLGTIEGYADRLGDHLGGTSGLAGAASGLAGAASGLAGSSFARRLADSATEGSEEDFRREVTEHLALIDERLQRLEDEMYRLLEGGDATEPDAGTDPQSDQA